MSSIKEKFFAVEDTLYFHHMTSIQPLSIIEIRKATARAGIALTMSDIFEMRRVWPDAYKIKSLGGVPHLEALDIPLTRQYRRDRFVLLLECPIKTELEDAQPSVSNYRDSRSTIVRNALRGTTPQWGGIRRTTINSRGGTLLERIRAKEASRQQDLDPSRRLAKRVAFLQSQLPQIRRICCELAQSRRTFTIPSLVDRIKPSLRTPLSSEDIIAVLRLLCESQPEVCTMITSGAVKVVQLDDGSIPFAKDNSAIKIGVTTA